MKITQNDLIGEIMDFPIEVVQKMVEKQMEQGNKADVGVFQKVKNTSASDGGFTWDETIEGIDFWQNVITSKDFDAFFAMYPKDEEAEEAEDYWVDPKGRRMLVWDNDEGLVEERIVIAKLPPQATERYITVRGFDENRFENGEKYNVTRFTHAKPTSQKTKLSLTTIAEKFGLSVDEIEIDLNK